MGQKREPPKQKNATGAAATQPPPNKATTDKLIQLLIKKGVITAEEGRLLHQP